MPTREKRELCALTVPKAGDAVELLICAPKVQVMRSNCAEYTQTLNAPVFWKNRTWKNSLKSMQSRNHEEIVTPRRSGEAANILNKDFSTQFPYLLPASKCLP